MSPAEAPEPMVADSGDSRPFAGRRAWIITDGKAGMEVQCVGVAEALGTETRCFRVSPAGIWRALAPWGPVPPGDRIGRASSPFAPPWPAIAIATGRQSIPFLRAIRRAAGRETFTLVIQNPRTGPRTADLIAVPEHDRLQGENIVTTLTAPHNFSAAKLAAIRAAPPVEIAALPSPKVTVILGGPNAVYPFTAEDQDALTSAIASVASHGASFLVTASRRTPPGLLMAVRQALGGSPSIVWDGSGANPYSDFLACGDRFIVTGDSVNMTGEACATGRPVHVFEPEGGSAKFRRFHDALRRYGATRPLPRVFSVLEQWEYPPLDSASLIARETESRWLASRARAD